MKLQKNIALDILKSRDDLEVSLDITDSISQENILVFDCKLLEDMFLFDDGNETMEQLGENIDEDSISIGFSDIVAYIKDISDEIEEELQEQYNNDDIRCLFNVYTMEEDFYDIRFVFSVSLEYIKMSSLRSLTDLVATKMLVDETTF